jgi:hypothetical protein
VAFPYARRRARRLAFFLRTASKSLSVANSAYRKFFVFLPIMTGQPFSLVLLLPHPALDALPSLVTVHGAQVLQPLAPSNLPPLQGLPQLMQPRGPRTYDAQQQQVPRSHWSLTGVIGASCTYRPSAAFWGRFSQCWR